MSAQKLVIGAALVALAAPLAAYGSWSTTSGPSPQKTADLYAIEKIEKTWHRATTKKSLKLMMSLWASNAVMTNGGKTYTGKAAIRAVLAKAGPFLTANAWISDTPAYKTRASVTGNKGTIYFECHYIDVDTAKVAAVVGTDLEVRRINGKWLVTHMSGSTVTLTP